MQPEAGDHVPPIERMGNDVAARMMQIAQELERTKRIIADLLWHVGERSACRGPNCKQEIVFMLHRNGKLTPYNPDGTSHYTTCPDRDLFSKRRKTNATDRNAAA